jgi:hypothetical protein
LVFVSGFVRLEAVHTLRDKGGLGEMRNGLAEARARSEGFTACVRIHLRLPAKSNRLHENTIRVMRAIIAEALHTHAPVL